MNILVTGGAGFIGSHLVDRLVDLGHAVVTVDDLSTGKQQHLNATSDFRQADIRTDQLLLAFEEFKPEVVFHVAAHASVSESVRDPWHDADINILGTINVAHACALHGVRRLVFSSTGGALYGEPEYLPADETHPIRPLSPYGASKAAAEAFISSMSRLAGVRYSVLRYGNVYGPRQDPFGEAGVVAIFTQALLAGEAPTIFGDGLQERDYIYVDDVVDANVRAMGIEGDGTFNIGTGQATNVLEVFGAIAAVTGYAKPPLHGDSRAGDVRRIYLDCKRANQKLGWSAEVDLRAGITRTVASMRD